jgi:hypothetical protein
VGGWTAERWPGRENVADAMISLLNPFAGTRSENLIEDLSDRRTFWAALEA